MIPPRRAWTLADLHYPRHLPVVDRREDLLAAIAAHQVVIIAGETGSGKTTQLPKLCLELGRGGGVAGRPGARIAHTQPRRIAARSVAERIGQELHVPIGDAVGYQVRFTDHSGPQTQICVMTDGILLNELQRDKLLRSYDTIIIDEAHERSLNIDFILGYLKTLLPKRPDLKVIVTSATIEPEAFAQHFADPGSGLPAPIIEVSGRTYPVSVRYRPLIDPDNPDATDRDQVTGIVDAATELWTEPRGDGGEEDILVFLSGEREIRDAADALTELNLPQTEVLPLYARLSAAEQHRVFSRSGKRRIVLATNVAETSLTVPGIRYVIDTGVARISRYSQRTKVQRLPIEPISQASANQRAGRCGRLADGICIRLYAQADFETRASFTDPEILRTNLAAVILQLTAFGLGDVRRFPFIDPPDPRQIADGVRLLEELGALESTGAGRPGRLTPVGRIVARLPVDPRLARMIVEADRLGCLGEVLVIAAALSIHDPRERPEEHRARADQLHARFKDPSSDFIGYLLLWRHVKEQQRQLSGSAFRRMCKQEFLHYLRVREWQDLHAQLRQAARRQGMTPAGRHADNQTDTAGSGSADAVHRALLAGLLSHVGVRDARTRDYLGARGARFALSPGSALFRKPPEFVVCGELVETSRLWGRVNARIDPQWAEEAGQHLVKRGYSAPRWSAKQGSALATERVTLFGVPLVTDRTVSLSGVDPVAARSMFIRHALVEGAWDNRHAFFVANTELIDELTRLQERARRSDLMLDEQAIYAFYDQRIPDQVLSGAHFDRWWKSASRESPRLLHLTEDLIRADGAEAVSATEYPTRWRQGALELPLTYQFSPGHAEDGVTVHIPLTQLNQLSDDGFDWLVPGLREELAVAQVKALPKDIRRRLAPISDRAREALAAIPEARIGDGAFTDALGAALLERTGVEVPAHAWAPDRLPAHLRATFRVEDVRGGSLGSGPDLGVLRADLGGAVRRQLSHAGADIERTGMTTWDIEDLPTTYQTELGGTSVQGFPSLVDRGDHVDLLVLPDRAAAEAATACGARRLLILNTSAPWKRVLSSLTNAEKLDLANNPHGSVPALLEDARAAAVDDIVGDRAVIRTRAAYERALAAVRTHLSSRVLHVVRQVQPVLAASADVAIVLDAVHRAAGMSGAPPWLGATVADVTAQHASLIRPGFIADTTAARLPDVKRYLEGMSHRLAKAATNPREPILQGQIDAIETAYADELAGLGRGHPGIVEIGWQIEELRISLFAESMRATPGVSVKRVSTAIANLHADQVHR